MTTITEFITSFYRNIQFREPTIIELNSQIEKYNQGIQLAKLIDPIARDTYTQAYSDPVIRMYQAAFNRLPDKLGLNYWTDSLADQTTTSDQLASAFSNSAEFFSRYNVSGSAIVTENIVTSFYNNIFNRAPDIEGLNYWVNSRTTVSNLLQIFSSSQEYKSLCYTAINNYHLAQSISLEKSVGSLFGYNTNNIFINENGETLAISPPEGNFLNLNDTIFLLRHGATFDNSFARVQSIEAIKLSDDGVNGLLLGAQASRAGVSKIDGGNNIDVIRLDSPDYKLQASITGHGGGDTLIGSLQTDRFIYRNSSDTGYLEFWKPGDRAWVPTNSLDKITVNYKDSIVLPDGWNGQFLRTDLTINGVNPDLIIGNPGFATAYTGSYSNDVFTSRSPQVGGDSTLLVWDADGTGPSTSYNAVVIIGTNKLQYMGDGVINVELTRDFGL